MATLDYTDLSNIPDALFKASSVVSQTEANKENSLQAGRREISQSTDSYLRLSQQVQTMANARVAVAGKLSNVNSLFSSGRYAESFMAYEEVFNRYKSDEGFKNIIDQNSDMKLYLDQTLTSFSTDAALKAMDKSGNTSANFFKMLNSKGRVGSYDGVKNLLPSLPEYERPSFLAYMGLPPEVVRYDQKTGMPTATNDEVSAGLDAVRLSEQDGIPFSEAYEQTSLEKYPGGIEGIKLVADHVSEIAATDPVSAYVYARRIQNPDLQRDIARLQSLNEKENPGRAALFNDIAPEKVYEKAKTGVLVIDGQSIPVTEALGKAAFDPLFRSKVLRTVKGDVSNKVAVANGLRELGINVTPDEVMQDAYVSNDLSVINVGGKDFSTVNSDVQVSAPALESYFGKDANLVLDSLVARNADGTTLMAAGAPVIDTTSTAGKLFKATVTGLPYESIAESTLGDVTFNKVRTELNTLAAPKLDEKDGDKKVTSSEVLDKQLKELNKEFPNIVNNATAEIRNGLLSDNQKAREYYANLLLLRSRDEVSESLRKKVSIVKNTLLAAVSPVVGPSAKIDSALGALALNMQTPQQAREVISQINKQKVIDPATGDKVSAIDRIQQIIKDIEKTSPQLAKFGSSRDEARKVMEAAQYVKSAIKSWGYGYTEEDLDRKEGAQRITAISLSPLPVGGGY